MYLTKHYFDVKYTSLNPSDVVYNTFLSKTHEFFFKEKFNIYNLHIIMFIVHYLPFNVTASDPVENISNKMAQSENEIYTLKEQSKQNYVWPAAK